MASRAMLSTGKSFYQIPMDLKGEITAGELLGPNGLATFPTGNWHNGRPS